MAYANAEMQKKLIIITAIPGIMDEWAQESAFKPQKRKLGLIAKHANDIKDWMLKDLEPESIEMVKRRGRNKLPWLRQTGQGHETVQILQNIPAMWNRNRQNGKDRRGMPV